MKEFPLVLLIEDERAVAKLVQFKMSREGYTFEHRDNGKEGLAAIKELKPDIVLLDVMLPGMNGFEVLKNVREDDEINDTLVIMLTSKNRVEDLKKGFGLQVDDYIEKPFRPDELMMRIHKQLS